MADIEDRVVSMSFEGTKFQSGISQTMSAMEKFNGAVKNLGAGAASGLDNIEKAASKISFLNPMTALDKLKAKFGRGVPEASQAFSDVEKASNKTQLTGAASAIDKLSGHFNKIPQGATEAFNSVETASGRVEFRGLDRAIEGISSKFSVLQGAASVALGNIASQASMRGAAFAKSFAFGPIKQGFDEYATNLNSIQTILANTQDSGGNLKTVNAALAELNTYSDKTIYNFSEMAKNIGTFTAAGVQLKPATSAIKGIANLAALSGSNSQQASTAMYQLSQAISAGRVGLQDWNSVVNAGMGGAVFQKSLMRTAENMGALEKGAVKIDKATGKATVNGKSFRESIMAKPGEQSWLSSDVLTKTLSQFTGDMSNAQLKAQGFSDAQIKAIQAQAKTAQAAATEVKTLSQVFDVARETIGSGWSKTFQTIFGDFGESKKTFTEMSNTINGIINASSNARNKMLGDWKKLGGREVLIEGLKQAFKDLKAVLAPIHDAFRDIFPAKTGKDLYQITFAFRELMHHLELGPVAAHNLRSAFRGVFALLDIGKQIIGGVLTAIGHMFGAMSDGSGGALSFAGNLGELITKLDLWLKKGDKIKTVFAGIGDVLSIPIRLIGTLAGALNHLFGGGDLSNSKSFSGITKVSDSLKPAAKAADQATAAFGAFVGVISKLGDALGPVGNAIQQALGNFGNLVADALANNNWDSVFAVLQTGLVAGIFLTLKKAIGGGLNIDLGGGALKKLSGSFDILKGSLVDLQRRAKAQTLLTIAAAVAVLSASMIALSLIKPEKLAAAMAAITIGMAQLMAGLSIMNKGGMGLKSSIPVASLVMLAAAIDVLTLSVLALSRLSWEELAKGLAGVVGMLAAVSAATIPLSKASPRMVIAGAAIGAIGAGLMLLGGAMKIFATMSWAEMGKGMAAVAASLLVLGTAAQFMPPGLPLMGAGLILVGTGLTAVATAVRAFGSMDVKTLAKGLITAGIAMEGIAFSMAAMPPTLPLTAAGLILAAAGLTAVAGAIGLMGQFKLSTIFKGIIGLAGALIVLAGGLTLMVAALPGAVALTVAAAALAVFVPVLGLLGHMSWGLIIKGLAAMALSLGVLAVVSIVAAPGIAALGVAIAVFGVGLTAVGAAVYLLAKGIAILADKGGKGLGVFIAAMTGMLMLMPKMITSFLMGIVEIVTGVAKIAPLVATSLGKILITLLDVIIQAAPKIAQAATAIVRALVTILAQNVAPLLAAGWMILSKILLGVASHITDVTKTVADIITKFLGAAASKAGQLTAAGANALAKFLTGIANNLSKVVSAGGKIVAKYIEALGNNVSKVVAAGASFVVKLITGIGNAAGRIVSAGVDAVVKFVRGIGDNLSKVTGAGVDVAIKLIRAISSQTVKLADEGAKAVIHFLHSVASTIRTREPEMIAAGADIGEAIVEGMVRGMAAVAWKPLKKAADIAGSVLGKLKKVVRSKSPSKETELIGGYIVEGLANGMGAYAPAVNAAGVMGLNVIKAFKDVFQIQSPSKVTEQLGKFVADGFVKGLTGSNAEIDDAMNQLKEQLSSTLANARQDLDDSMAHLDKVRAHHKASSKAVKDASETVRNAYNFLQTVRDANANLVKGFSGQLGQLHSLANEYEKVTQQLDAAKTKLDDMKGYRSGIYDQFSSLPEIPTTDENGKPIVDSVGAYTKLLGASVQSAEDYKNTLDQLLALGLDDVTYKKLLAAGPAAGGTFASQLLKGGADAIASINALDSRLGATAGVIADHATEHFYGIGINAQQGLVDGLNARINDPDPNKGIIAAMTKLANDIVKAIKKKLHIKSPSRVFDAIGRYTTEGLANGLTSSSKMVTDAAASVGDDAISAMQSSMSRMSEAMNAEIDSNPTITPVLDLSYIKKGAKELGKMTDIAPVSTAASYGLAAQIDTRPPGAEEGALAGAPAIKFEQNNYSPEALSQIDIYRQTNNQLSQAKDALGLR